jgi:hypothetical protein
VLGKGTPARFRRDRDTTVDAASQSNYTALNWGFGFVTASHPVHPREYYTVDGLCISLIGLKVAISYSLSRHPYDSRGYVKTCCLAKRKRRVFYVHRICKTEVSRKYEENYNQNVRRPTAGSCPRQTAWHRNAELHPPQSLAQVAAAPCCLDVRESIIRARARVGVNIHTHFRLRANAT